MKILKSIQCLGLLLAVLPRRGASEGLQCFSYPVGAEPPRVWSENMESEYQRQFDFARKQGLDMGKWEDTALFSFQVYFHYLKYDPFSPDPKTGEKPDPKPVDTLSPLAFKAWAQVLFSHYEIFDYYDPQRRLSAPSEPDYLYYGLATKATLMNISKECFTRVVEAATRPHPLSIRKRKGENGISKSSGAEASFDLAGRKNMASSTPPASLLFRQ